jgi:hypothetical protein
VSPLRTTEQAGYEPGTEIGVAETLDRLYADGYVDFSVEGRQTGCPTCDGGPAVADLDVVEVHRSEGESNPDDESIVVAVACRSCGWRGVLVSAYGSSATNEVAEFLTALRRGAR